MSDYLFVHICMHVTYSNKILDNEPVTTFPMNATECCIGTSKKQDGSHQWRQHAHVREKRYSLECEHKKRSEITGQRSCCGRVCTPNGTAAFEYVEKHDGLGRASVKLQSLYARLRVGDVSTHSGVNSWPCINTFWC
jgi:hypothetical protein